MTLTPGSGVSFLNNVYFSTGSTFTIHWNGVDYHSLADWRNAVGLEILNSLAVGLALDPKLLAPGADGTWFGQVGKPVGANRKPAGGGDQIRCHGRTREGSR